MARGAGSTNYRQVAASSYNATGHDQQCRGRAALGAKPALAHDRWWSGMRAMFMWYYEARSMFQGFRPPQRAAS